MGSTPTGAVRAKRCTRSTNRPCELRASWTATHQEPLAHRSHVEHVSLSKGRRGRDCRVALGILRQRTIVGAHVGSERRVEWPGEDDRSIARRWQGRGRQQICARILGTLVMRGDRGRRQGSAAWKRTARLATRAARTAMAASRSLARLARALARRSRKARSRRSRARRFWNHTWSVARVRPRLRARTSLVVVDGQAFSAKVDWERLPS